MIEENPLVFDRHAGVAPHKQSQQKVYNRRDMSMEVTGRNGGMTGRICLDHPRDQRADRPARGLMLLAHGNE